MISQEMIENEVFNEINYLPYVLITKTPIDEIDFERLAIALIASINSLTFTKYALGQIRAEDFEIPKFIFDRLGESYNHLDQIDILKRLINVIVDDREQFMRYFGSERVFTAMAMLASKIPNSFLIDEVYPNLEITEAFEIMKRMKYTNKYETAFHRMINHYDRPFKIFTQLLEKYGIKGVSKILEIFREGFFSYTTGELFLQISIKNGGSYVNIRCFLKKLLELLKSSLDEGNEIIDYLNDAKSLIREIFSELSKIKEDVDYSTYKKINDELIKVSQQILNIYKDAPVVDDSFKHYWNQVFGSIVSYDFIDKYISDEKLFTVFVEYILQNGNIKDFITHYDKVLDVLETAYNVARREFLPENCLYIYSSLLMAYIHFNEYSKVEELIKEFSQIEEGLDSVYRTISTINRTELKEIFHSKSDKLIRLLMDLHKEYKDNLTYLLIYIINPKIVGFLSPPTEEFFSKVLLNDVFLSTYRRYYVLEEYQNEMMVRLESLAFNEDIINSIVRYIMSHLSLPMSLIEFKLPMEIFLSQNEESEPIKRMALILEKYFFYPLIIKEVEIRLPIEISYINSFLSTQSFKRMKKVLKNDYGIKLIGNNRKRLIEKIKSHRIMAEL